MFLFGSNRGRLVADLKQFLIAFAQFEQFNQSYTQRVNTFFIDGSGETILHPTEVRRGYEAIAYRVSRTNRYRGNFLRNSLPLLSEHANLSDGYLVFDFLSSLYLASKRYTGRSIEYELESALSAVTFSEQTYEQLLAAATVAPYPDEHRTIVTAFIEDSYAAFRWVDLLRVVVEHLDDALFFEMFAATFGQKRQFVVSYNGSNYTVKLITFGKKYVEGARKHMPKGFIEYYLSFFTNQSFTAGDASASKAILTYQCEFLSAVEHEVRELFVTQARLFRILFGSVHSLDLGIYIHPILSATQEVHSVGGYFRIVDSGKTSPNISLNIRAETESIGPTVLHELLHFSDEKHILRLSKGIEGVLEELHMLRTEALTTAGELFVGKVRNLQSVKTLPYSEDVFEKISKFSYNLAQLMAGTILLSRAGVTRIHMLSNEEFGQQFLSSSPLRARLESEMPLLRASTIEVFFSLYLRSCADSQTEPVPAIVELARRLQDAPVK